MTKEEAKNLSYLDVAYNILKKEKNGKTTKELFKEICELLDFSEEQYFDLVGDFYTSLNLDKRFILLDSKWELKENHSIKTVIEDELDELDEIDIDTLDELDEDAKEETEDFEEEEDEVTEDVDIAEDEEEKAALDELTVLEEDEIE